MKFTLRDLFWLVLVVALVGWCVERNRAGHYDRASEHWRETTLQLHTRVHELTGESVPLTDEYGLPIKIAPAP